MRARVVEVGKILVGTVLVRAWFSKHQHVMGSSSCDWRRGSNRKQQRAHAIGQFGYMVARRRAHRGASAAALPLHQAVEAMQPNGIARRPMIPQNGLYRPVAKPRQDPHAQRAARARESCACQRDQTPCHGGQNKILAMTLKKYHLINNVSSAPTV